MKITNWGHRDDFDTIKYFEFWKSLNSENYSDQKNIHPLYPEIWNKLYFLESNSIDDFVEKYAVINPQKLIYVDKILMLKAMLKKFKF
ncbi:hypothetical protein FEM08_30710 [Flavobacterium gilvum]|nr:hypothetical protein FEM08_30710 [Flavobacterium gilvum]